MPRHFLKLSDLDSGELMAVIEMSARFKQLRSRGFSDQLRNKIIALLMELPSTRTRLSFQVAATEMGGHCVNIERRNVQLERGEPISDFSRICSHLFAAIVVRSLSHQGIKELANTSAVPVINALSNSGHPCQVLADLLTLNERFGDLSQLKIAWLGDGNNVCLSWIEAAGLLGLSLSVGTPQARQPKPSSLPDTVSLFPDDPYAAIDGADVLMTDVWSSMGDAELSESQKRDFAPFQINSELLARAGKEPVVLHCMPIHRGEEISDEIIDSPASLIFEQAANRLHTHKGILQFLLADSEDS